MGWQGRSQRGLRFACTAPHGETDDAVRKRFQIITGHFAGFQAQSLNVHVDFPLLQRIALPITIGSVRFPGIKIHDQRIIRLLELFLHKPDPDNRPNSKLEAAYHKADKAIENIVTLLKAA
jgi:hypothetical protein